MSIVTEEKCIYNDFNESQVSCVSGHVFVTWYYLHEYPVIYNDFHWSCRFQYFFHLHSFIILH